MTGSRKLRAGIRISLVSAVFWGLAAVLGRIGAALLGMLAGGRGGGIGWELIWIFLPVAAIGFVGGAIYAAAIALMPQRQDRPGISAGRTALFGGIAGVLVFLIVLLALTLTTAVHAALPTAIIMSGVCGLLGAATGLGMLGTAQRARLPRGPEPPESLAP